MAIQKSMVYRKKKQGNEYEWSDRSKSMRSAGGTSNTREVRSAIKNTARSFATPMRTPSVARSGYAKKLRTQELRGKSQISYKKPNTTTLQAPTTTPSTARALNTGRKTSTSNAGVSNRIKTAVDKRDYATPESNIGRRTRNKMINKRYGR